MPDGVAGAGGKQFYYDASEDMSGDDGMMSADEMCVKGDPPDRECKEETALSLLFNSRLPRVALMNNTKLLMQSSTNGTVMKTGANRDADGTIDRSPPPTPEVSAILFDLKRITDEYGIDMMLEFRSQGATVYGTITKSRFNSILTSTFGSEKGFFWDDKKLDIINHHYGTGANDLALGGKKLVAWMDVCEDLGEIDASFPDNQYKGIIGLEYKDDVANQFG